MKFLSVGRETRLLFCPRLQMRFLLRYHFGGPALGLCEKSFLVLDSSYPASFCRSALLFDVLRRRLLILLLFPDRLRSRLPLSLRLATARSICRQPLFFRRQISNDDNYRIRLDKIVGSLNPRRIDFA